MTLYLLFESASGYALFERLKGEEIAQDLAEIQRAVTNYAKFSKCVKLVSFIPFLSAQGALENINSISEGLVHEHLHNFLESNLPKKKKKFQLGVAEDKLGGAISEAFGVSCTKNKTIVELLRGVRLHFPKFIKLFKKGDVEKAQLGLGHSYSRAQVKFNVNRADNMIIQSISLLDTLDKDLNTYSMRIKEWYSWHFPELVKSVSDNYVFARLVKVIGDRSTFTRDKLPEVEEVTMDSEKAEEIFEISKASMGTDISPLDLLNISMFATRVIRLAEYRLQLQEYLKSRMGSIAPNLSELIGEHVGARLISHAGSLTNLAKYPASTVQILGAEKALFRALKTRGKTPKYGLIFHSSFIGRASAKNKGRISRYLANKCSMASRIDAFRDPPTSAYGKQFHEQVEERLQFYDTGVAPRKNIDAMKEASAQAHQGQDNGEEAEKVAKSPSKKRKRGSKKGGEKKKTKTKGTKKKKKTPKKSPAKKRKKSKKN